MGGTCATYADSILMGKLSDRDHLEDLGIDGKILFKMYVKEVERSGAWTGLWWLWIRTGGGRL
jgi:hypothetical protein